MTTTELGEALHAGRMVFGTLLVSPSPRFTQAVSGGGLDFVFIDLEHIAMDREQVSWMCQAYAALGLPPLVRIPSPDPYAATQVLDGGAAGVIAPYVESVEEVRALRGAVKLRPIKGARLQSFLEGAPCEPELAEYIRERSSKNLLIINIESVPAMAALDEILKVPDIDAILIGPHDLSCSMGLPEKYDHPDFLEAVRTIFRKARAAGVGAGIHFSGDVAQQAGFIRDGGNFIIHSSDIQLFARHLAGEIAVLRQSSGTSSAPTINI